MTNEMPEVSATQLLTKVTEKLLCAPDDVESIESLVAELTPGNLAGRNRVILDPDKVERGLAQLVLTVIELLRQLMERQALRRVEHGTLSDAEIERLGLAFMRLDERMEELLVIFELKKEDLNINLGPLGNLL
ncbi:MAG: gas vesicle protein K [Chloroflexales bacterium]